MAIDIALPEFFIIQGEKEGPRYDEDKKNDKNKKRYEAGYTLYIINTEHVGEFIVLSREVKQEENKEENIDW